MLSDSYVIDTNPPTGYIEYDKILQLIDEAKKDMPKHYVYTDYTHDFGIDPITKEFEAIKKEDYPKYVHIPDDEEWLTWAKKWFGDLT